MSRFPTPMKLTKKKLESLYKQYNKREFVHPDPLEFIYNYTNKQDQEVAGLIASSLAYGKVAYILKSVNYVLSFMGESPSRFLAHSSEDSIATNLEGFRHRFANQDNTSGFIIGLKRVLEDYQSLEQCFLVDFDPGDNSLIPAMTGFVRRINARSPTLPGHLLPSPEKGSACKRLNLFLRWMVRKDSVDPGGWDGIPASKLLVPLDTHMHKIGIAAGFTKRRQGNLKAAQEVTQGFLRINEKDPVKYDFALTRFGIRDDMEMKTLLNG